nr:hypothetical protein [Pandoravirus belohorizontensis]
MSSRSGAQSAIEPCTARQPCARVSTLFSFSTFVRFVSSFFSFADFLLAPASLFFFATIETDACAEKPRERPVNNRCSICRRADEAASPDPFPLARRRPTRGARPRRRLRHLHATPWAAVATQKMLLKRDAELPIKKKRIWLLTGRGARVHDRQRNLWWVQFFCGCRFAQHAFLRATTQQI